VGKKKSKRDDDCCKRYKDGRRPCDDCPRMAALGKKERRKLLDKYR
jgi:hypothetical protein